jgi:hypothetical protein
MGGGGGGSSGTAPRWLSAAFCFTLLSSNGVFFLTDVAHPKIIS